MKNIRVFFFNFLTYLLIYLFLGKTFNIKSSKVWGKLHAADRLRADCLLLGLLVKETDVCGSHCPPEVTTRNYSLYFKFVLEQKMSFTEHYNHVFELRCQRLSAVNISDPRK